MTIRNFYPVAALCLSLTAARAQPAFLDSTFNHSGTVISDLGLASSGSTCTFTTDNKLLVAGRIMFAAGQEQYFITAYDDTGALVTSFGIGGTVTDTFQQGFNNNIGKIKEQADGKLVVVGSTYDAPSSNIVPVVARFNADGSRDATFGINGVVQFANNLNDLVIQPDGKILLCGEYYGGSYNAYLIIRLKTNGTPDSTFGTNGITTVRFSSSWHDAANAIGLQSDGKIIVAGGSRPSGYLASVARLNTNGSVDSSFGPSANGRATLFVTGVNDAFKDLSIGSDNSIVLSGNTLLTTTAPADGECFIAKYTANGLTDNTFNGSGLLELNSSSGIDAATGLALQPNNKIVVGGYTEPVAGSSSYNFFLFRFNATGSLDTSFGSSGFITSDFATGSAASNDQAWDLCLENDGRIAMCGASTMSGHQYTTVAKYLHGRPVLTVSDVARQLSNINLYPNPVTTDETLNFSLENATAIAVSLTDMQGRQVAILAESSMYTPGNHSIKLAIPDMLQSGNYVINLISAGQLMANIKITKL